MAEDCEFQTENYEEAVLAAAMMNNHIAVKHSNPASTTGKAARVDKPSISSEMSPRTWLNTVRYWKIYKNAANLKNSELTPQLISCCDPDLRERLMNAYSNIEDESEEKALQAIKEMSVKSESIIVAQVNHMKCRQGRDEPVRSFYARLKGQASVCDYTVTHTEGDKVYKVSFEDKILRQILATNIEDNEIQTELLSQLNLCKTPMTADEMVNFIEAKENGKKSSLRLCNIQSTNAISSSYKKSTRPPAKTYNQSIQPKTSTHQADAEKCSHCNKYGHGNHWGQQGAHIRKKLGCPTYGKRCSKCHRLGHFEVVCRTSLPSHQSTAAVSEPPEENIIIGGAINLNQD